MIEDGSASGDGWPREMVIRVDQPRSLMYLLFVREAWGFAPLGAPTLDPLPDPGRSHRPPEISEEAALARWAIDWSRALEAYEPKGQPPREPDAETLAALRDLSDAELVLWAERRPVEFWEAGVDTEAFAAWLAVCGKSDLPTRGRSPEHLSLPALIAAWRTGIETILEVPIDGYLVERMNISTLMVSSLTRSIPDLYSRALNEAARA